MASIVATARPLDLDHIRAVITQQLSSPGAGEYPAQVQNPDVLKRAFQSRPALRVIDIKNPANVAAGRVGPHGDCGLRDQVASRLSPALLPLRHQRVQAQGLVQFPALSCQTG